MVKNLCKRLKNTAVKKFSCVFPPSPSSFAMEVHTVVFLPEAKIVKVATVLRHVLVVDVLRHAMLQSLQVLGSFLLPFCFSITN